MCTILFTVRNLNNGNFGEKSDSIYLAVLAVVPCPLKITLQCSADKKVWEPLFYGIVKSPSVNAVSNGFLWFENRDSETRFLFSASPTSTTSSAAATSATGKE